MWHEQELMTMTLFAGWWVEYCSREEVKQLFCFLNIFPLCHSSLWQRVNFHVYYIVHYRVVFFSLKLSRWNRLKWESVFLCDNFPSVSLCTLPHEVHTPTISLMRVWQKECVWMFMTVQKCYVSDVVLLFSCLYSGVLHRPREGGAQSAGAFRSPLNRRFDHPVRLRQGLRSVWEQPANVLQPRVFGPQVESEATQMPAYVFTRVSCFPKTHLLIPGEACMYEHK